MSEIDRAILSGETYRRPYQRQARTHAEHLAWDVKAAADEAATAATKPFKLTTMQKAFAAHAQELARAASTSAIYALAGGAEERRMAVKFQAAAAHWSRMARDFMGIVT